MANSCKYYKQQRQVSYDGGVSWQNLNEFQKGELYERNSADCGFILIYRWALSAGDYECDGLKKYNVEVLQFTTEQGGDYENVSPEYKRRTGDVVDRLSTDCGYEESTGAFKFSGTSVVECDNNLTLSRSDISSKVAPHSVIGDCTEVIGNNAFSGSVLQTLDFSDYTKEIGSAAFTQCSGLTNMVIPDTVEKIGSSLFENCKNLTGATLPSGIDYIPGNTFFCTNVTSYTVANGVKVIGGGAFADCYTESNFKPLSISLPNSITDIGIGAFVYRELDSGFTYPNSVKYIGKVSGNIVLPSGLEHIAEISNHWQDRSLEPFSGVIPGSVKLVTTNGYCGSDDTPVYSEGTEMIECVKNVLPNSVNIVGSDPTEAEWCDYITIPGNVLVCGGVLLTSINYKGSFVFESNVPPLMSAYDNLTPSGTGSLLVSSIFVPDESVELYKAMWSGIDTDRIKPISWFKHEWRNADISQEYECVGYDKHYVQYLWTSVDNGSTWYKARHGTQTGSGVIIKRTGDVYEYNSFDCGGPLPTNFTLNIVFTGGTSDFIDCNVTNIPSYKDKRVLSAHIGNCARTMEDNAFQWCGSMTSLTIDNGITYISNSAFQGCSSLSAITIPDSVATIGTQAFDGCGRLSSVTLGSGITNINNYAFQWCYYLTSVTVLSTIPPTLGNSVFVNTSTNLVIYVPGSSVETYKAASGWSDYADRIQAIS